ncbi:MAG: Mini-ribonuclease 3 [Ruminococcaceae bacterium]|nr:Mini-ribonuclease 3 [Oscillospiraceae bacterium]
MLDFEKGLPPEQLSPLTLAFVGDAVYEVFIRTKLSKDVNMQSSKLHKQAIRYVSAVAQSAIVHAIEDKFTDEETAVYKRGRNAHTHTSAKNADIVDYRHATGFEALIGYLYLKKDSVRLNEILEMGYNAVKE